MRAFVAVIAVAVGVCAGTVFGGATTEPSESATSLPAGIVAAFDAASQPAVKEAKVATSAPAASASAAEKAESSGIEQTAIRPRSQSDSKETGGSQQVKAPMMSSGVANTLQVGAALAVVVGLIFIGKAFAKKYLPQAKAGNGKGVIEVLARYPLSKNQSLVLVRIGSQIVTLNQGKETSQSVLVINEPTEVAKIMGQIEGQNTNSIQAGFSKLLANARMDLEDPANDPDREEEDLRSMEPETLDSQLEEMASARRQLMELRQQVRSVRESLLRD